MALGEVLFRDGFNTVACDKNYISKFVSNTVQIIRTIQAPGCEEQTSHGDLPLVGLPSPLSLPLTTLLLPFPSRVIDMVDLHDALTDLEKLATVPVPHVLNTTRCTHMQVMTQTLSGCSVKTTVG